MAAGPLSVAVHSTHRLIGEALAICLSAEPDLVVAGHTHNWVQLAALCRLRRPEVLIVEAATDLDAVTIGVRSLTQRWPGLSVVVVSEALPPAGSAKFAAAGVELLVPYDRGVAALIAVLQELLAHRPGLQNHPRQARLTDRELAVLRLVGAGLTVGEIAKLLGIGPRGVENHKRRIFAKLGANSQSLAVSSVATMGLLDPRPQPICSEAHLSRREKEVLCLAAQGASMRQMAHTLGVAPKTIESQLSRLYGKLGVHNRAAAVAVAHAFGLVPEDKPRFH